MKNAKRLLAVILVLAITVSCIAVNTLTTSASDLDTDLSGGYPEIKSGEVKTAVIAENGQSAYFSFTPEEDGYYAFYSMTEDDTYGYILDADMNELAQNDDTMNDLNFQVEYQMQAGTTYILCARYLSSSYTGSFDVSVWKLVPATSVEIMDEDFGVFHPGGNTLFSPTFYPENAAPEEVTWSSSNSSVVSIDADGWVEFLSLGTATITVTSESGLTDTYEITVVDYPTVTVDQPTEVYIPSNYYEYVSFMPTTSGNYRISCTNTLNDSGTYIVLYHSDYFYWIDSSNDGVIDATLTEGEQYFIGIPSDYDTTYTVTVIELAAAESIIIEEGESISGYVGEWHNLHVTFTPELAMAESYTWSSSNPVVATVDEYGNVDFLSEGTSVITVTSQNGLIDTIEVVVQGIPEVTPDTVYTVEITSANEMRVYEFTPQVTGTYAFAVKNEDADSVCFEISEESGNAWGWYISGDYTFHQALTAGETYTLETYFDSRNTIGTYTFEITKIPDISSLEIVSLPTKMDYYEGLENFSYEGLEIKATLDNGTVEYWEYDPYNGYQQMAGFYVDIMANYEGNQYSNTTISCGGKMVSFNFNIIENPVASIELVSGTSYTYIENYQGSLDNRYNEETGEYEEFFYYSTYYPDDAVVQINYKDGTSQTANIGDKIDGYWIEWYDNQYDQPWVVGTNNNSIVSYLGATVNLPITVIANPVESIEVVPGAVASIVENTNGEWRERYNEATGESDDYFHYDIPDLSDILVQINYKDGSSTTAYFYDCVSGYYDDQDSNPWVVGGDNYITIEYMGATTQLMVEIVENPVESIELVSGTSYEYVENYDGSWSERYNEETGEWEEFFWYDTRYPNDAIVRINYKDGTSKTANVGDEVDGDWVSWGCDQFASPWKVGINTQVAYVSYLGVTVDLPITVVENPVESIELISGTPKTYIENYDGYWRERYNEETGEWEEYFHYYTQLPDDLVIQIHYKDGTSQTANAYDEINGYWIAEEDNQYNQPWVVGSNNQFTISYLGATVELPITVMENPVESIELISGTSYTYVENYDGFWNERYNEETGEWEEFFWYYTQYPYDAVVKINYKDGTSKTANVGDGVDGYGFEWRYNQDEQPWVVGTNNQSTISYLGVTVNLPITVIENPVDYIVLNTAPTREYVYGDITIYDERIYGELQPEGDYWFYPTDLTGLSFTVYYKDGTTKTYTSDDIEGYYYIDGYEIDLFYDGWNPEPGNFPVTLSYLGSAVDYTVVLKEPTVASIEMVKGPDKATYSDYYRPFFEGTELRITYTDGTRKVVTVTEENLTYDCKEYYGFYATMDVDGYTLQFTRYWAGEEYQYFASYLGQICEIDLTFTEGKEVASVALENVSWNGDGMIVNVTYEDETTETIVLDDEIVRGDFEENEYLLGYGKTENGFLNFYIETYFHENDEVEFYYVYIFGEEIEVYPESDVLIGDVNSDGVVNAKDVASLRRYLAGGWDVTIAEAAADVNADGTINAKDVASLRRYLAGGWNVELG